jgi:cytochrome c oxidase subunit I
MMSSIGAYLQAVAGVIFAYNIFKSWRSGDIAGNDPWGAPSLEWSIPSPPPEYNFAVIPTVTSRYPLWDMKSPALTSEVPHTKRGDERIDVDTGGKHAGAFHAHTNPGSPLGANNPNADQHKTARQLGIPMPNPTIRPLFVALFMTLMFASLLLIHKDRFWFAISGVIAFAMAMTFTLYSWLLTPLEDAH